MSPPHTRHDLQMNLLPWARQVFNHPARKKLVSGGRGILKTTSAFQMLTCWTLDSLRQGGGVYTGPYHNQLKASVWQEVNAWLESQPVKIKTGENGNEMVIRVVDGKWLSFIGLDKYDRKRGIHPLALVNDEAARARQQARVEVIEPAMQSHQGPWLDITTPRGGNWWKREWLEGMDPRRPDVACWKIKAADVGMISPEALAREKARLSPAMFAQEWEGEFTGAAGPIFPEFVERTWPHGHLIPPGVVRQIISQGGYSLGALDWAYSGTAAFLWLWVTKWGGLIVLDELTCSRKTPAQMTTMLKAKRALPPMVMVDYRCWGLERDGRNVADDFRRLCPSTAFKMADKRFPPSIVKLNDLMTLDGQVWPRFGIEMGKAPQTTLELLELQEEDLKLAGGGFRDGVPCDGVDALRYGAMAVQSGVSRSPVEIGPEDRGLLWSQVRARRVTGDDIASFDPITGEPRWGARA